MNEEYMKVRSCLSALLEMFGRASTEEEKAQALKELNGIVRKRGIRVYRSLPGSPMGLVVFLDAKTEWDEVPTSLQYSAGYVEKALHGGGAKIVKSRYCTPGTILAQGSEHHYTAVPLVKKPRTKAKARKRGRR